MEVTAAVHEPEYFEVRTMPVFDLFVLIKRNNWYTKAVENDYYRLARIAECCDMTTAGLVRIAKKIAKHSELPDDFKLSEIMQKLVAICEVSFIEGEPCSDHLIVNDDEDECDSPFPLADGQHRLKAICVPFYLFRDRFPLKSM